MKRVLLTLAFAIVGSTAYAQKEVTIKAGTIIPLKSARTVKAADVSEGETVDFLVAQNVYVNDVCVIEKGTNVKGKVVQAKRSTIAGTKGRLGITIEKLILNSGDPLFFSGSDIHISGKNRTPLAVVLACLAWPCIFIPGSKAKMPEGYEVFATVSSSVTTKVE